MKSKGTILVVDDEEYVRDSLARVLERSGYGVRTAADPRELDDDEALQGLDGVITDLRMPGMDGIQLTRSLCKRAPDLPVVVLTAYADVPSAVECMKSGACDFLQKPADPEKVLLVMERALKESGMRRELAYLRSGAGASQRRRDPLGVSQGWKQVLEVVRAAAPSDSSVLLLGESGVGKDEVSRLIHRLSNRADRPFVRVNCGAVPVDLFESEFFGHRKGAFTGALNDREGRFRVAHQGTLFMDEIACMPQAAQAKVLRVLQEGTFERVGETRSTSVDVRIIAATNADLESEIRQGNFRRDLYYRINVITIPIPPLRERRDDIEVLASAFLEEFSLRFAKPMRSIEPEVLRTFQDYDWPGNIRELRNVLERAVLLEQEEVLTLRHIPSNVQEQAQPRPSGFNLRESMAREECRLLKSALREAGGVRRKAAELLGIDERNLPYYLNKHDLKNWGQER
ncbi:MAG TPA: sigma-54 dependent transcriptional regulator [Acidobacteriota bacterium]|nr:sigma-54 dependent transcriptional regulator [Acidobacteriota bacterium]